MKVLFRNMVLLLVWVFCFYSYSNAQTQTSNNLIYSTVNPPPPGAVFNWSGFVVTNSTGGGISGGHIPGYNISNGTFYFGYTQSTINYTMAVNSALSGTGIKVDGIKYGFQYYNQDLNRGSLSTTVTLTGQNQLNGIIQNYTHTLPKTTGGWTNFDQTQPLPNYAFTNISSATMSFTGKDDRFWAGYYGPMFRDQYIRFTYSVDLCVSNPLSSPDCPGYAQAFFNQQCTASPLYNATCPGYAVAYKTQQCTANPLFDPTCPGYSAAYFNQQCTANPLYNQQCPGYTQAYFDQQCSLNSLYDTKCAGYQQAYFAQQCAQNPLYNGQCPGYQQAYFNQQCTANALYNIGCPGYQAAFFAQQCNANQLYNVGCPGYQQAYFNQQCTANQLYSPQCPGYADAYRSKLIADSCAANPQSSPQCPGYRTQSVTSSVIPASAVSSDPVRSISEPQLVSDPVVNQVVSASPTSSTSATNPVSPVNSAVNSQPALGSGITVPGMNVAPPSQSRRSSTAAQSNAREQARRDALQTGARAEQQVKSEQERQQETVMAAMGTIPGFDAYQNARLPDAQFYVSREIYRNATIPDNRRAQRALSERSDRIHQDMVNQQYRDRP